MRNILVGAIFLVDEKSRLGILQNMERTLVGYQKFDSFISITTGNSPKGAIKIPTTHTSPYMLATVSCEFDSRSRNYRTNGMSVINYISDKIKMPGSTPGPSPGIGTISRLHTFSVKMVRLIKVIKPSVKRLPCWAW